MDEKCSFNFIETDFISENKWNIWAKTRSFSEKWTFHWRLNFWIQEAKNSANGNKLQMNKFNYKFVQIYEILIGL